MLEICINTFKPWAVKASHDEECPIPRQRGPAQRQRDRACAAAHRAKQQLLENGKLAATADTESTGSDENPQQGETPAPAVSASPQALPPPTVASAAGPPRLAAPAGTPRPPPAAPTTQLKSTEAAPAQTNGAVGIQQMQRVTLNEVQDEVVREESEVKVFATGVFENCPDETLSEDYYLSLRKFVCSETHLQSNIAGINIAQLSSNRQTQSQLFMHRVQVELSVKTACLTKPPLVYLKKHLEKYDWLKGNKTRITLAAVCYFYHPFIYGGSFQPTKHTVLIL